MTIGSGLLFSFLLLCRIMDIAYCVTMTLIFSCVYLMPSLRNFRCCFNTFHRRDMCGCSSTYRDDY